MSAPTEGLWAAYVARLGDGMTQKALGEKVGVDQSTIGRWINGDKVPTAGGDVAHIAIQLGQNPLAAFVAAGFITIEDAGRGLSQKDRDLLADIMDEVAFRAEHDETMRRIDEEMARREAAGEILSNRTKEEIIRKAISISTAPLPERDRPRHRARRK